MCRFAAAEPFTSFLAPPAARVRRDFVARLLVRRFARLEAPVRRRRPPDRRPAIESNALCAPVRSPHIVCWPRLSPIYVTHVWYPSA